MADKYCSAKFKSGEELDAALEKALIVDRCCARAEEAAARAEACTASAVLYTEQELTEAKKTQARANIGAADESLFEKIEPPQVDYPNLLDMDAVERGVYINPSNGATSANASYGTTDYIHVSPGQNITLQYGDIAPPSAEYRTLASMNFLAAFDADKNCIGSAGGTYLPMYSVPAGVAFIRVSHTIFMNTDETSCVSIVDSAEAVDYTPFAEATYQLRPENHNNSHIKRVVDEHFAWLTDAAVLSTEQELTDEQKEQARENIGAIAHVDAVLFTEQELTDDQKAQARANIGAADESLFEKVEHPQAENFNLLNMDTIEYGCYINNKTGTTAENASYATTDYIPVSPGQNITLQYGDTEDSGNRQILTSVNFIAAFDADKNVLASDGVSYVASYTVPQGVAYIRMSATVFVSYKNKTLFNVVDSTEVVDYIPYGTGGATTTYQLRKENHDDSHIKAVAGIVCDAYLPKHIYCAVGRTIELYNNQVCLQANKYHLRWRCNVGKALKRKFSVTGAEGLIGNYTLSLEIYDDTKSLVWEGKTTLHIVSDAITAAHSVCPIGDSLTNGKYWLPEVVNLSDGKISFVGTYAFGLDDASGTRRNGGHEGRSGFTAKGYINGDPYTYNGATESPNNIFWNGTRFSWAKYKSASGLAPNAVQIFLGTNGIAEDNTENADYIKQMVDYIRQDDATIPVFVVNTIYRGTQDGIGVQQSNDGYASQVGVWKYNEDKKVIDLMMKLDALLDGYSNVHMVNLALTHDSEYNFGAVETPVNPRAAQTEPMPVESVHPQKQGYFQMADVMFSVMCGVWGE